MSGPGTLRLPDSIPLAYVRERILLDENIKWDSYYPLYLRIFPSNGLGVLYILKGSSS